MRKESLDLSPAELMGFPRLNYAQFAVIFPACPRYNCLSFALGVTNAWIWPDENSCWLPRMKREVSTRSFAQLMTRLHGDKTASEAPEQYWTKLAVFRSEYEPNRLTHVARQLQNGRWVSKLGATQAIEHSLRDLEGPLYGRVDSVWNVPRAMWRNARHLPWTCRGGYAYWREFYG